MTIAFTFPGQGSQGVGMGKALADAFPEAKAVFDEVDEALGQKLSDVMWTGPEETLTLTANAQPALMAVSLATMRVLEARGLDVTPQIISSLDAVGDLDSVAALEVIYKDEIGHVAVGRKWFEYFCDDVPEHTWRRLVKQHFHGAVKPPFNDAARAEAGFGAAYYSQLT